MQGSQHPNYCGTVKSGSETGQVAQGKAFSATIAGGCMCTSGCGDKEDQGTSGCVAGKPAPWENRGWITMKTSCKSRENTCSPYGMGWACLETLQE